MTLCINLIMYKLAHFYISKFSNMCCSFIYMYFKRKNLSLLSHYYFNRFPFFTEYNKAKILQWVKVSHTTGAYPSFWSIKWPAILLLLLPDASSWQGYPQHLSNWCRSVHIHVAGKGTATLKCPSQEHNVNRMQSQCEQCCEPYIIIAWSSRCLPLEYS